MTRKVPWEQGILSTIIDLPDWCSCIAPQIICYVLCIFCWDCSKKSNQTLTLAWVHIWTLNFKWIVLQPESRNVQFSPLGGLNLTFVDTFVVLIDVEVVVVIWQTNGIHVICLTTKNHHILFTNAKLPPNSIFDPINFYQFSGTVFFFNKHKCDRFGPNQSDFWHTDPAVSATWHQSTMFVLTLC